MGQPIATRTSLCTGHGCWPPRENRTWSHNVYAEGLEVHRLTDEWRVHCCVECHDGRTSTASQTVFCNGLAVARIGDCVDCGSKIMTGRHSVIVGG